MMMSPDPWQAEALFEIVTGAQDCLMVCSRGAGKSEVSAVAAYAEACLGGFALVFSRSDRQAKEEIFDRVVKYHREHRLVEETRVPTAHDLRLSNGGRVLALPCAHNAASVIGKHKVSLLIIDEAARVPDEFFSSITPVTILGKGRIVLPSTPYGQRGFFWKAWKGEEGQEDGWKRFRKPWTECPRMSREAIERERRMKTEAQFAQEFGCVFQPTTGAMFDLGRFEALGEEYEVELW